MATAERTRRRLTRAESAERTRAELMRAARRVFLRQGFHGTTLDQVAEEAGFTKGAVYSRFESKADLFLALLDEHVERRRRQMREFDVEAASPRDFATAGARQWREFIRREGEWSLLLIEFWVHAARDPRLRREFAVRQRALRENLVEQMKARLSPSGDGTTAEELALATMAMGNGFTLERLVDPTISDELYVRMTGLLAEAATKEES